MTLHSVSTVKISVVTMVIKFPYTNWRNLASANLFGAAGLNARFAMKLRQRIGVEISYPYLNVSQEFLLVYT